MESGDVGQVAAQDTDVLTIPLGSPEPGDRVHGLITVARRDREFSDDDRTVLSSLAAQATASNPISQNTSAAMARI